MTGTVVYAGLSPTKVSGEISLWFAFCESEFLTPEHFSASASAITPNPHLSRAASPSLSGADPSLTSARRTR